MNKQEPGGPLPPDPTNGTATAPDSLEQQLEKERQARVLMRDRLRHTEALAAESHALRSAMAQELEKVTADRDRLRAEAATAGTPAAASATAATTPFFDDVASPVEPTMTFVPPPKAATASPIGERPLAPPARRGPWRALAMLGGLAVGVAFLAWLNGSMPSVSELASTAAPGRRWRPTRSWPRRPPPRAWRHPQRPPRRSTWHRACARRSTARASPHRSRSTPLRGTSSCPTRSPIRPCAIAPTC